MIRILFYGSWVAIGIGLLLHIIGLGVSSWSVNDFNSSVAIGLWKKCTPDDCESYDSASVEPIRALVMIGMFAGLLGLGLFLWKMCCGHCCDRRQKTTEVWVAVVATSITTLFTTIGVIIWSTSIHEDLYDYHIGTGYGLCLSGGLLIGAGGLGACVTSLKIIENLTQVHDNSPHHPMPSAPPITRHPASDPPPPYPYP